MQKGGSPMYGGYWGKILRVDLSERKIEEETIPESVWKKVLGGAGFGAKILYDEVGADIAPLSPENRIIFGLGPLQATKVTGAAKFSVVSKSPLTGIYADSAAGGEIYSGRAGTYDWDDASADRRCSGAGDDERYYYYDSPAMGRE